MWQMATWFPWLHFPNTILIFGRSLLLSSCVLRLCVNTIMFGTKTVLMSPTLILNYTQYLMWFCRICHNCLHDDIVSIDVLKRAIAMVGNTALDNGTYLMTNGHNNIYKRDQIEITAAANEIMILSRDTRQSMRSIFEEVRQRNVSFKKCVTYPFISCIKIFYFRLQPPLSSFEGIQRCYKLWCETTAQNSAC